MNSSKSTPALQAPEDVRELSQGLAHVADALHNALRKLTTHPNPDPSLAYALLTEEYALRARINILVNDADRHTVAGLNFSQSELLNLLEEKVAQVTQTDALETVRSIVSDLITLASAIVPGKSKTINFLVAEMSSRVER